MPEHFAYETDDGRRVPVPGTLCGAWGEQSISIDAAAAGNRKRFKGKAYSGGALTLKDFPHPVVVDLAGLTVPSQTLPTPKDHNLSNLVGETDTVTVHATDGVDIAGFLDADAGDGQLIAAASKGGLDWELSIGAPVHEMAEVRAGETILVNGRTFAGPLFVARKATLREVSWVRKGADLNQTYVSIAARLVADHPLPAERTEQNELDAIADVLAGDLAFDFGRDLDGIADDAALESLFT